MLGFLPRTAQDRPGRQCYAAQSSSEMRALLYAVLRGVDWLRSRRPKHAVSQTENAVPFL